MKSTLLYIIGGIVLFVGIILFVVGFGIAGFKFENLGTAPEYEEKTYISSDTVTSVIADDSNVSVEIIPSNDDKVHITYFENKNKIYTITENNGVINLDTDNNFNWFYGFFNFNLQKINLVISIPENYSGDLQIKTSNAKITVQGVISANLTLKTSNSSINISNFTASGDVSLDSSNGKINLEKLKVIGELEAETSNSSITINDTNAENIELETSNGKIEFEDIEFTDEFKCKSSNGHIEGTLKGNISDYSIESDTSNADNSLPDNLNGGDKQIDFKTSNADIDVDFEN